MRGTGVTANYVHPIDFACQTNAGIQFLHVFHGEPFRHPEAYRNLPWNAVHGVYVGEVHYCSFIPKMLQWNIGEVEMHVFEEHIRGDENVCLRGIFKNGSIVSHTQRCRMVFRHKASGEPVYETELTET